MAEDKNIFQKIGDAVVNFAPGIAGILAATGVGAPAAGAVAALGALGKAFGLGTQAAPEDILKVVSADPEIQLKAMIAENDFKVKMKDFELQEMREQTTRLQNDLLDVQSARSRDETIRKSGKSNVRADVMLGMAFITVVAIYSIIAYFGETKIGLLVVGSMLTAAGTFVQKIGTAYDFEFGSSRGSVQKTEDAAEVARALAKTAASKNP